jgi:hypothetical protein
MLRNYRATSNNSANLVRGGGAGGAPSGDYSFRITDTLYSNIGGVAVPVPLPINNYVSNGALIFVKHIGPYPSMIGLTRIDNVSISLSSARVAGMYLSVGDTTVPFGRSQYKSDTLIHTFPLTMTYSGVTGNNTLMTHNTISGNAYNGSDISFNEVCIFHDLYYEGSTTLFGRFLIQRFVLPTHHTISGTNGSVTFYKRLIYNP